MHKDSWTFRMWSRPMRRHFGYQNEQLAISAEGSSWKGPKQDVHVVFSMHTYHPVEVETDYDHVKYVGQSSALEFWT